MKPSIGRIVHYVSYGTPGGEYGKECRAAVVTEVMPAAEAELRQSVGDDSVLVGLCVLNPTGQFFNRGVAYHETAETPGKPDCPNAATHGTPHRYCACGWAEATPKGGTWHWPEPVPREPGDRPPRY